MSVGQLCPMLSGSLDGRGIWGRMDTRICMAESLCCSPETVTTLLISYTPIQNKKLKKKRPRCTTGDHKTSKRKEKKLFDVNQSNIFVSVA